MNLDRVTITGADDSIHPQALADLTGDFPFVEWAILVSAKHTGTPRYPSLRWREELDRTRTTMESVGAPMRLSLHLCGGLLRDLLLGHPLPARLASGYQRMQLNFHGERIAVLLDDFCAELGDLAQQGTKQIIFQIDGADGPALLADVLRHGEHSFEPAPLFDVSHGAGVLPRHWPAPFDPNTYHGYAGGLGPDNLAEQIPLIGAAAGDARIWIDMETRVRSPDDRVFDLDKVERCLKIASPFVTRKAA